LAKRRRLKRYHLSFYRQILRRLRLPAFLLAALFLLLGTLTWFQWISWPQPPLERWLLSASLLSLLYWAYALLAPLLAYVQPRRDHLRLQTPFYRLNISYRRIRSTRPVDIAKAFPPETTPPGFRRTIRHFYGTTALGIDLSTWPLPRWLLAILLGRMILAPDQPGLILITRDWIELSNQLESMLGAWNDDQRHQLQYPGANVGEILNGSEEVR
jgi:hypothetical protein